MANFLKIQLLRNFQVEFDLRNSNGALGGFFYTCSSFGKEQISTRLIVSNQLYPNPTAISDSSKLYKNIRAARTPSENVVLGFDWHLLAVSSILQGKKMFVVGKRKENPPYKTIHCSLAHRLKNKWAALGLLSWKILERSSKFTGEKEKMHYECMLVQFMFFIWNVST